MVRLLVQSKQWIIIIIAAFIISACGGGGGGGSNPSPSPTPTPSPSPDVVPDEFSIAPKTDQLLSTQVSSDAVTITGIDTGVAITVQNGEYAISGGNFTSAAGTIENDQSVVVRGMSSDQFATSTTVTVTVNETSTDFVITTVAQDTTPEDFTFTAATNAERSTTVFSNTVTITGITGQVPISVSNGLYQIGDGEATTEAGTIENDQTVIVSGESSSDFSTITTVTLTVGTLEREFSITTAAQDTSPEPFSITDTINADLSTEYTSDAVTVSGINDATPISVSAGGSYSIGEGEFTSDAGTVTNGQVVRVKGMSAATNSTSLDYTLTIGDQTDTYTISTVADTTPPTAEIVFPTKVSLTDGTTLTVRGTAQDASGIDSVTVTVMNGDAQVDQVAATSFIDEGFARWSAQVTLTAGTVNTISVSVTDTATNTNGDASSVSVTHNPDYTLIVFPEGSEGLEYSGGKGDIVLDNAYNRILFTETRLVTQINLETSVATDFIPFNVDNGFNSLGGLNIFGNTLYFTDLNGGRIYKTPLDEVLVDIVSDESNSNSNADIKYPVDVAVTQDGVLYVPDGGEFSLYSVNADSGDRTLISDATRPVDGENAFSIPYSIALKYDSPSVAYIADIGSNTLFEVDMSTGARSVLIDDTQLTTPDSIELDSNENRILIVDEDQNKVLTYGLDDEILDTIIDGTTGTNTFMGPRGLAFDADKNLIYFVSRNIFRTCSVLHVADPVSGENVVMIKSDCYNPL